MVPLRQSIASSSNTWCAVHPARSCRPEPDLRQRRIAGMMPPIADLMLQCEIQAGPASWYQRLFSSRLWQSAGLPRLLNNRRPVAAGPIRPSAIANYSSGVAPKMAAHCCNSQFHIPHQHRWMPRPIAALICSSKPGGGGIFVSITSCSCYLPSPGAPPRRHVANHPAAQPGNNSTYGFAPSIQPFTRVLLETFIPSANVIGESSR